MLMGAGDIYADGKVQSNTTARGSITMRMLMGAGDIYADGKVQSNTTDESSPKRSKSPDGDKGEKLEYLIRDALDRECPPVTKRDGKIQIVFCFLFVRVYF